MLPAYLNRDYLYCPHCGFEFTKIFKYRKDKEIYIIELGIEKHECERFFLAHSSEGCYTEEQILSYPDLHEDLMRKMLRSLNNIIINGIMKYYNKFGYFESALQCKDSK